MCVVYWYANLYAIKHTLLKPFATKGWPFYRRMQGFMPGAQPRGTHSFDPSSSGSSGVAATQALDKVNEEHDGEEDEAGPPVDTPMANMPAVFNSTITSLFPSSTDPSSADTLMANTMPNLISSLFPSAPDPDRDRDHDTASFPGTSSSRADAMPPPFSSSISPTSHVSVNHLSVSHTTSSTTPTTSSQRKRKRDSESRDATKDMLAPPLSTKRASKNKTDTMNPVIITSQLNSTLNRLADVIEKTLDVAATSEPDSILPSGSQAELPGPSTLPSTSSSSDSEVLDKALEVVTADKDFFSEDDLLGASLLFSNNSSDIVRIARTFIALSNTPSVQHRFLVHQLKEAGLHTGKGKGKAIVSDHDFPMMD